MTIGADGLGLISYYDKTNENLKVAHCANTACTSVTTTTIDSTGIVGGYSSSTIGADGLGLISYVDQTNETLKVAHCDNTNCTSATTFTLDSPGAFAISSITVGADGLGLISYYEGGLLYAMPDTAMPDSGLKVLHCHNTFCSP